MSRTVVIAGGGPTGLMLAGELRLAGVSVVVLEPRTEIIEHSPGMAVHGRSLELLDQRGLGDDLRDQGMFAWPRTPFAFLWLDLDSVGPEDYTYALPQWRAERLLDGWATGSGADVRRGHTLVDYTADESGVTVTARSPEGEYELRAAYLVGCDGGDSTVRRLAGIDRPAHESSSYYGVLGDVEIAEGEQFDAGLHPAGVFGVIPIWPGTLRLMTIEFGAERPSADVPVTEAELTASIERIVGKAPEIARTRYLARFGEQSTVAERFRDGRVLLAGDAAHTSFISGTQGLNAGLQDAVNLGWKLAAAIHGHAGLGLLDTYHQERHPAAIQACTHARAQMALIHPLAEITPLRRVFEDLLRFEDVNRYLLRMPTGVRCPTPGPHDHDLVGRRLGGVVLHTAEGPTTAAATLRHGRGVLLRFTDDSAAGGAVKAWGGRVDSLAAEPVDDIDAPLVLLRPDGHVAYAGTDPRALDGALRTWFGEPDR
ncbi:FAD-dependent monooxygenase [Nocardia takedensis]|uniref:FAD-dependent monooxygenase n=1 Tax=Nocardia takedensis TaxID=259390 RepID=UPI0002D96975|nr:FAD-dependent monooxygenase [Nocardia takedensis]